MVLCIKARDPNPRTATMASLPAVNFAYGKMFCFYREFGDVTDDVFVRLYTADYKAMKYERNKGNPGEMKPFTQRSMQVRKVPANDPLSDAEYGTFLVYRASTDRVTGAPQVPDKSKRLFVVTPKETKNEFYGTFWVGDHFTFQYNSGLEENKKLQLHKTSYLLDDTDLTMGTAKTIPSPLPTKFVLPKAGFERMLEQDMKTAAPYLYDLMHRPFSDQRWVFVPKGGSRRRMRGGATPDAFEDLWYSLPIRSMTVVGIRVGRTYDVSVYIRDNACSRMNRILLLKCLERDVEAEIAKGLEGYNADNFGFYDPPDDISDM
jgi:hypothetical protein